MPAIVPLVMKTFQPPLSTGSLNARRWVSVDQSIASTFTSKPIRRSDWAPTRRSEEHTSELQSLMRISYAVFCLKKKNKKITQHKHTENSSENTHKSQTKTIK